MSKTKRGFSSRTLAEGDSREDDVTGEVPVVVNLDAIEKVKDIINVEVSTDPDTSVGKERNIEINGNSVGMTISSVSSGTTLTAKVLASGE